jgi:pimeloyl-ACP methyl ester carboxylesterase
VTAAAPRGAPRSYPLGRPAERAAPCLQAPALDKHLVGLPRSPEQFIDAACRAFGLGVAARAAARARLERRVGERMADLDLPRAAARLDTPALIVHDGDDREVPWSDGAAIAGAWPGAELATTEGLGHRRILRAPRVVDAAVTFVAARLPRCGCGRLADASGLCAGCRLADHLYDREARRVAIAGQPSSGPRASRRSG